MSIKTQPRPAATKNQPAAKPAPKPAPAAESKALVPRPENAVGPAMDFSADAGLGNENVRPKDMAIPFLCILQKNSPQVDPDSPKFVEGAEVGMIFNNVTNEIYDGKTIGITVVPCTFAPKVVEWVPREQGGGIVNTFEPTDAAVQKALSANLRNDKNKLVNEAGNLMVDTAYHFVVYVDDGQIRPAVIGMTSTQLKTSRAWNSTIQTQTETTPEGKIVPAPRCSRVYQLTTAVETKDQYTYYNWRVKLAKKVDDIELYEAARSFTKAVTAGAVQTAAPVPEEEPEHAGEDRPF